ncbi:MAG: hypothetical protein JO202_16050 [Ktedonobacteraceae bacterium]|nr:hypothetical protein [Ktedonobacteraceae bacterium]
MRQKQKVQPAQVGLDGALAGLIATGPMTLFMLATQRLLPKGHQYALPPEIITGELAQRMNVRPNLNKPQLLGATLVSHFGYGAGMGILYSPLSKLPLPSALKGVLFGVMVWAASYLVLLPMLGMSETGHREPSLRNFMMIGAHVVWGSVMGVVADMLVRE